MGGSDPRFWRAGPPKTVPARPRVAPAHPAPKPCFVSTSSTTLLMARASTAASSAGATSASTTMNSTLSTTRASLANRRRHHMPPRRTAHARDRTLRQAAQEGALHRSSGPDRRRDTARLLQVPQQQQPAPRLRAAPCATLSAATRSSRLGSNSIHSTNSKIQQVRHYRHQELRHPPPERLRAQNFRGAQERASHRARLRRPQPPAAQLLLPQALLPRPQPLLLRATRAKEI